MRADEEIRQRFVLGAALAAIPRIGCSGEGGSSPRQRRSQRLIDIKQRIQGAHVGPWDQKFGVNDDVDVERRAFAAGLQLLHRPVMPGAGFVDAIEPDVGVDEHARGAVIVGKANGGHGARPPGWVRRRE